MLIMQGNIQINNRCFPHLWHEPSLSFWVSLSLFFFKLIKLIYSLLFLRFLLIKFYLDSVSFFMMNSMSGSFSWVLWTVNWQSHLCSNSTGYESLTMSTVLSLFCLLLNWKLLIHLSLCSSWHQLLMCIHQILIASMNE